MLEVAKCIATDPQLILLDEVMAGLTLAEARAPIEIIKELRADGMTILDGRACHTSGDESW